MNNESSAGQIVQHAHFHIIPRFANDGLRHWSGKSYLNKEDGIKIARKISVTFTTFKNNNGHCEKMTNKIQTIVLAGGKGESDEYQYAQSVGSAKRQTDDKAFA